MRLSIFNKSLFIALFILICFPTINPLNAAGTQPVRELPFQTAFQEQRGRQEGQSMETTEHTEAMKGGRKLYPHM